MNGEKEKNTHTRPRHLPFLSIFFRTPLRSSSWVKPPLALDLNEGAEIRKNGDPLLRKKRTSDDIVLQCGERGVKKILVRVLLTHHSLPPLNGRPQYTHPNPISIAIHYLQRIQ